ncbi:MAG: hypothetical protein SCK70_07100 [bacterium]|nr:hypothetical protein [bacterium]
MIIHSVQYGIKQLRKNIRMVLLYYLLNLAFALVIAIPFRFIFADYIGSSLMGERLAAKMDMDFLFEFLIHNSKALSSISGALIIVAVLYWLLQLFLSGGALAVLSSGESYSAIPFWKGAAQYFGKFLRLSLWALPVLVILLLLPQLWNWLRILFWGSDPAESVIYYSAWLKMGVRYLCILLFALIFDYARIHAVIANERKMRISLVVGMKFSLKHIMKTLGLSLLFFIAGGVAMLIYNPIADLLSNPAAYLILILFLLQQLYMFWRMALKITKFSSQLHLFNSLSNQPSF